MLSFIFYEMNKLMITVQSPVKMRAKADILPEPNQSSFGELFALRMAGFSLKERTDSSTGSTKGKLRN